jgi:hypothetical protein
MASAKKKHMGAPIFVKLVFEGRGARLKPWAQFLYDKAFEPSEIGGDGRANMEVEALANVLPEGAVRDGFKQAFRFTVNLWLPCERAKAPQVQVA